MTTLDDAFEWNPFDDLDLLDAESYAVPSVYDPLDYAHEAQLPLSELPLAPGFLYECATCQTAHSPTLPCNGNNYSYLQEQTSYTFLEPVYVEKTESAVITANYRKWLLSVAP